MTLLDLEIRIPGPFVVLQGLPGDGLVNTMDSCSMMRMMVPSSRGRKSEGTAAAASTRTTDCATNKYNTNNRLLPLNVLGESWPLSSLQTTTTTARGGRHSSLNVCSAVATNATEPTAQQEAKAATYLDKAAYQKYMGDDTYILVPQEEDSNNITSEESAAAIANVTTATNCALEEKNQTNSRKSPRHSTTCSPQSSDLLLLEEEGEVASAAAAAIAIENATPQRELFAQDVTPNVDDDDDGTDQQTIVLWQYTIQQKAEHDYYEWHENCSANRCTVDSTSMSSSSSSSSSHHAIWNINQCRNTQLEDACCWWIDGTTGQLAVLNSLPGSSPKCRTIGSLAPGMTIIATRLHTLSSVDWTPLHVTPLQAAGGNKSYNANADGTGIYPAGQEGWVQVLEMDYICHDDDNDETITTTGYVALSCDGYSFLGPGLPCSYCDPMCWIWRVTCIDGAFVRQGLDLSTNQIGTIPHGGLLQVHGKTVNAMGLSRLQVSAVVNRCNDNEYGKKVWTTERITGWCSEFLNPMSGQRGFIAQPLPFPVPALYRVILPPCAVIRGDIELSSPEVGQAPVKAILSITGRAFTEHPADHCIDRLRLAGNGGWISLRLNKRPPEDLLIVEMVGLDPSFDPEHAGRYHLDTIRGVQRQQVQDCHERAGLYNAAPVSPILLSELDDGGSSTSSLSSFRNRNVVEDSLSPLESPSCTYTARSPPTAMSLPGHCSSHHEVSRHAPPTMHLTSTSGPTPTEPKCLICLCEDRTATIIHGGTGHIACCLMCARILKARGDPCPVCRLSIDAVIQHFWA